MKSINSIQIQSSKNYKDNVEGSSLHIIYSLHESRRCSCLGKRVSYRCSKCGKESSVSYPTYWKWNKTGRPELCLECSEKYRKQTFSNTIDNRTASDKERIRKNRSIAQKKFWNKLSDEDKKKLTDQFNHNRDVYLSSLSEEELKQLKQKRSEGLNRWKESLSKEDKEKIVEQSKENVKHAITYNRSHRNELSDIAKRRWNKMSEEDQQEKMNKIWKGNASWRNHLDEEESKRLIQHLLEKRKEWFDNLSDEERVRLNFKIKQSWDRLNSIERSSRVRSSLLKANGNNKFHQKFEQYFKDSYISRSFHLKAEEYLTSNGVSHAWDYGIYDLDGNLQMVVDLDGAYFHADMCDYNGIHNKEENDEKRFLSVSNGVKYHIIYEKAFSKSFELMIKALMEDYDEFINDMFKQCRMLPDIPYPTYSKKELVRSYYQLCKITPSGNYNDDISLNNRFGDRLINQFHHSIYSAKCKGFHLSPYEAWHNDELLKKIIRNRIIYINRINPNKILQGFNIAKVAKRVTVFSAGRAKLIVSRYLSEYDIIFDPFSGFSGRLLGTIASGKHYIGQDISPIHVRESNEIIEFLQQSGFNINAEICCKDITQSYGEYPCLFTCPPYQDKEQWLDVKIDMRTCDDWIDLCINHFKCQRYVFVVDHTEKYVDNIVDTITNKSHMNKNEEYIIVIDK